MRIIISLAFILIISISAFCTTIYDIQYTTVAGTGSYPSLLINQVVTVKGVVIGTGFLAGKYMISEGSGAWKSIVINDAANSPLLGDSLSITGTVNEVSGCTEIGSITNYTVLNSGNALPAAVTVTPGNLLYNTGEAYESVLIKLVNVRVSVAPIGSNFTVTDNTSSCQISDGFYPQPHTWTGIVVNQVWSEINGIVNYSSGQYRTHPRNDNDMIPLADINNISVKIDDVEAKKGEIKAVNVLVSKLESSWNINKYSFKVGFNKRILTFVDVDITSSISNIRPEVELSIKEDSVYVTYVDTASISSASNNAVLVKLLFKTLSYGESILDLTSCKFNDTINAPILNDGKIGIPISKKIAWLSVWNDNYNKKNIFNPWQNQKITIEYGCLIQSGVASSKAIVRIYDVQGRLVATPINKIINASDGIEYLLWDGRDKNRNLLPIGVYYCHLEIIDRVTGNSETTVQPIVVAAELK